MQPGVGSAGAEQFFVRSLLDDFALAQHENAMRVRTVESRCATTKQVRRSNSFSNACWILCSVCGSTALVASSR